MQVKVKTSSYPGWIKSPHVVTLGILKVSDLDSLTIFTRGEGVFRSKLWCSEMVCGGGGYSRVNFGHPKSEVFRNVCGGGGVFRSKLWSSQI